MKKYYVVIDTETCNSIEQPLVYDIGYAIVDKKESNIKFDENGFVVSVE